MKYKKFALLLILSLLVSVVLTACGAQTTTQVAETQAPQSAGAEPVLPTEVLSESEAQDTASETEIPMDSSTSDISFANDVNPIIQSRCINCHGGDRIEEGLVFFTYEDIMAGSDNGPVVIPGDPENSSLVELVANKKMPKRGPKLTPQQVQLISDWVAAGAPNN